MRIALGVEYDGSGYSGWQAQQQGVTLQQVTEQAVAAVANHPVRVHCAGRTDRGVHAFEQVIHFDTTAVRSERAWLFGTNANLPKDVVIRWVQPVDDSFHARFSATGRAYRYLILQRPVRPPLLANRVCWSYRPLDLARMQQGAEVLVGTHNFTSFRAIGCQAKSPIKTIRQLRLWQQGDLIGLEIAADAFLYHMVRNIAGVLMAVGSGEAAVEWVAEVLAAEDRTQGGVTAPAAGLYLTHVDYPPEYRLPQIQNAPILVG